MARDQIKQILVDVCKTQNKMGWYGKVETFSDFVVRNKLESVGTHYAASYNSRDKQRSRQYIGLAQFLSSAGLGNEVKLELRLPRFSHVCIQCQHVFCNVIFHLQVSINITQVKPT